MSATLIQTLLLFVPANILALYAALGIQGRYLPLRRLAAFGLLAGTAMGLFRAIPGPIGLHMPLQVLLLIGLVRYLSGGRWSMAVLGVLVTQLLGIVGEGLVAVPVLALAGIPLNAVFQDVWLGILGGWLGNILLILLCGYLLFRQRRVGPGRAA